MKTDNNNIYYSERNYYVLTKAITKDYTTGNFLRETWATFHMINATFPL